MWRELLALLASLAASPEVLDSEPPRAAAAVSVARASMAGDSTPPAPQPTAGEQPVISPPLVPVKPQTSTRRSGRIVCQGGTCYWVDEVTGTRYRIVK